MRRWILGMLGAVVAATAADAQTRQYTSGYVVIRVILEPPQGGGFAGGGPGLGGGPGFGGDGGTGSPDGGGPGAGPGGPPGRGGGPGGPPGRGGPGGAPGGPPAGVGAPGGFGGFGGGGQANASLAPEKSVVAVVPFTSMVYAPLHAGAVSQMNPPVWSIKHKYGRTVLFQDNSSVQFYLWRDSTEEAKVRLRHDEWRKNRLLNDGYRLCRDALNHGMLKEAFEYSRELANQVKNAKDVKVPADVQEFVTAFNTFESIIDTPPAKPNDVERWRARVNGEQVTERTHYALIHPRDFPIEDINRRLDVLENNFKAFYLWHAMARKPLPLPQSKLIVILPKTVGEVERMKISLDGSTIVSDSTYTPFHNIVVLSPERMDNNSRAFKSLVRPLWAAGYTREDLLRAVAPRGVNKTPDETARAMTLALVDKCLEDEADFAALSREATRQLYVTSGLLPQNVNLPEWVEDGAASFFQKPKGPLMVRENNRSIMTVSKSAGYGSPNFVYRKEFHLLQTSNRLNPDAAELLQNVVGDRYYDAARKGLEIDPPPAVRPPAGGGAGGPGGPPAAGPGGPPPGRGGPGGPPGRGGPGGPPPDGQIGEGTMGVPMGQDNTLDPQERLKRTKEELERKSHTLSWALTYYLAQTKIAGLHEFYAQLRRMPRDLHLDEKTVWLIFCRTFNLMNGDEIDPKLVETFASDWIAYMKNAPFYHLDVPLNELTADPGAGGGFGPGGGPGGPGGGRGGPGAGGPGGGAPGGGPGNPG